MKAFWLGTAILLAFVPSVAVGRHNPCKGFHPCDLGGDFTISEIVGRFPTRVSGLCASRCFWEAAVNNSCFTPDAVVEIHAPVTANTGRLNRLAAEILVKETKSPGLQQFLRTSGAAYRLTFTRVSGRDLIKRGAPACQ